jgi:hypothetical protein
MVNNLRNIDEIAASTARLALDKLMDARHRSAVIEFLALANNVGPYDSYKVISQNARDLFNEVRVKGGEEQGRIFLRCVLAHGVAATVGSNRFRELPPRIAAQQALQLKRIAADADVESEWLSIDHDLFQKEFGLATMRLYAAAAQLVDYRCGVPRSLVLREGLVGLLPKLRTIMSIGGFRPYFQIHTHKFMLGAFNEQGWEECYLCCAELYSVHPEVLGMYGSSWFYDPALDNVSPRLAYLRNTPISGGAHLFFDQTGGDSIDNSLSTSPTRRKLYDDGTYMPKSFMLIWPKQQQILWAQKALLAHAA